MKKEGSILPEAVDALLLLGWMEQDDAIGFLRQNVGPGEPMAENAACELWRQFYARTRAVASSRTYNPPDWCAVRSEAAVRLLDRAGGRVASVVAVDPAALVAFQFYLDSGRVADLGRSGSSWPDLCLQAERPRSSLHVTRDGNSLFFDVPHGEHVMMLTAEGELRVQQNDPYVKVADIGSGRLMLRAGYHRAAAYMLADPAPDEPFLAALTRDELVELDLPGIREKLTAASPPLLGDFLAPGLTKGVKTQKYRFRFKVTAEMESIPIE